MPDNYPSQEETIVTLLRIENSEIPIPDWIYSLTSFTDEQLPQAQSQTPPVYTTVLVKLAELDYQIALLKLEVDETEDALKDREAELHCTYRQLDVPTDKREKGGPSLDDVKALLRVDPKVQGFRAALKELNTKILGLEKAADKLKGLANGLDKKMIQMSCRAGHLRTEFGHTR